MGGAELPADHQVGQLLAGGLLALQGADGLSGAKDGDAVGDAEHLAHLVADEDDALSLAGELFHDGEESLHLDVGEGGGGLVQNQQLRAAVERFEDLHALLLAHGDFGDELVELHLQAVLFGQGLDLLAAGVLLDEHALGLLVAEDDVLKHRHGLHQHKVLVHHADAKLYRLGRVVNLHLLAVEVDLALGGLVEADEDVHQRGLAGTVFPQEGMYLALQDGEVDIPVGVHLAEALGDVFHPENFFHGVRSLLLDKRGAGTDRLPSPPYFSRYY